MNSEKFEILYDQIIQSDKIKHRELKKLEKSNNNIGFFTCKDLNDLKQLTWIITCLDIKFNRIYVYMDSRTGFTESVAKPVKNILELFSDIIVPIYTCIEDTNWHYFENIKKHIQDNVYVLSNIIKYSTLKVEQTDCLVCLSYNSNIVKRNYENTTFQYSVINGNTITMTTAGSSIFNPVLPDFYIPAGLFSDFNLTDMPKYINLETYFNVYTVAHNISVDYIRENVSTKIYDMQLSNVQINKFLTDNWQLACDWTKNMPGYKLDSKNADLFFKEISTVFVNTSTPQVIVENINCFSTIMPNLVSNALIFDNADQVKYPERNIHSHLYHLRRSLRMGIRYNNNDQLFKRTKLVLNGRRYGAAQYEQTLSYLTKSATSNILVVLGDKIILTKSFTFDTTNIWNGYLVDGESTGYIDIFNIDMMRKEKIDFVNFKSFIKTITSRNIPYTYIKPEEYGMVLPLDFEKYNGKIFSVASTKDRILYNYFTDKYNYNFKSYENNNRYNQL